MRKSTISKAFSIGITGLLFFVFQACVHAPRKRHGPCDSNPLVYQQALLNLSRSYKGLSGKVKVHVETPDGKFSFTGSLYAQPPGRLHFDIFGFLHRPKFLMIKDGNTLAWKDFDSGRHYEGPLDKCPEFPVKFPFSPLFLRDFIRILFLDFPLPLKILPNAPVSKPCRFLMMCAWGKFDLLIDPDNGLPAEMEGPKGQSKTFKISFSGYSEGSSYNVPHRYGFAANGVKMEVEFKSLEVNPKFPTNIFVPLLPSW